jgi:hypothetical protein
LLAKCRKSWRRRTSADVRTGIHWAIVNRRVVSEVFAAVNPPLRISRITSSTQLVIDGFPRSGNSYARNAFLYSNGADVPVSTHRHSPRSIETGLRRGIPVIVILRPPGAAIASFLQYAPGVRVERAIEMYRSFYGAILPICHSVVVAPFDEVRSDFGHVIVRCNDRFGSTFVPYLHTPEAEATVAQMIDTDALRQFQFKELPQVVGRPSHSRFTEQDLLARLEPVLMAKLNDLKNLHDAILRASPT